MASTSSPADKFIIGQLALELVEYTIERCGKRKDKGGNFPYRLYNTLVDRILTYSLDIHEYVVLANSENVNSNVRIEYQKKALGLTIAMKQLIRVCYEKRWITPKQQEIWVGKIVTIMYKIKNWMK